MTFKDKNVPLMTLAELVAGGFDINRILLTINGTIVYVDDGEIVLGPE
jgi:hypothetical protein